MIVEKNNNDNEFMVDLQVMVETLPSDCHNMTIIKVMIIVFHIFNSKEIFVRDVFKI